MMSKVLLCIVVISSFFCCVQALDKNEYYVDGCNLVKELTCKDYHGPMRDCADWLLKAGKKESGTYVIQPIAGDGRNVSVYCDMETNGGGYILIFRNEHSGYMAFGTSYESYINEIVGENNDNYWIGLEQMHRLTAAEEQKLRVDVTYCEASDSHYMEYPSFKISDAASGYIFTAGEASDGTLIDHLVHGTDGVNGQKFSGHNNDNDNRDDRNCAQYYEHGWWFNSCGAVRATDHFECRGFGDQGAPAWPNDTLPIQPPNLRKFEMRIRPANFKAK